MSEVHLLPGSAAADAPVVRSAGVAGVGSALPHDAIGNDEIAARLGVDARWIERRTGIRSRRRLGEGRVSDLATAAGAAALADADLDAEALDLVLVATMSQDELTPNTAPLVAHALGTSAGGIDVGAACTGFLSGLALGSAVIEAGRAEHVLLVGAEAMTRFVDPDDRRTAALFGDGAGAVVLSAGAGAVGPVVLRSAGEHAELIVLPRYRPVIRMEGHDTFIAAVGCLCRATAEACERAGTALADVDLFVYHQANRRILDAVGERLAIGPERVVDAIADVGNTSAASLPLALAGAIDEGRLAAGDTVLMGAVGAGFTYGAAVLEWGPA